MRWRLAALAIGLVWVMCGASACGEGEAEGMQEGGEALVRSAGSTSYYVDGERGDDGNEGTAPERAWRSLGRVNSVVFAPGDRILFRAGTRYSGQLRPQGSGGEGAPIVIQSFGKGPRPRIDAEGKTEQALLLKNVEYWEVRDLELTNQGPSPAPDRRGVLIVLEDFGTAHGIRLSNLFVHDVNGSNVKGFSNGILFSNVGEKVKSRYDGLTIENCHLLRTDRNGITGWSAYWPRDKWYPSLHVVIRGNLLEDIGGDGIVPIGCDGTLIERNTLRGGRMRALDYAAGIWPWSCDNTVIQFNEVSGMKGTKDGQGFDSDWNCRNTLIQYNYSHDNEGGFLLICNDGNAKPPASVGNVGTVVRYNISQNDGARTFHISAVEDTTIYNNTIYVGNDLDVHAIWHHDWGGYAKDTRFYNNIFYVDGKARYEFAGSAGNVFEGNAFFGNHEGRPEEARAITADPMLVGPGSGGTGLGSLDGYKLREGSPCVGAGIVMSDNGGRDFWGNAVAAEGPPDIGAHQLGR